MADANPQQSSPAPDEAALVSAVQAGDPKAFAPLVDRHLDHVRGFIALQLAAPQLVNEITHETFVFAYRNIQEFSAGTAFRTWLRAIALNLVRSELQRQRREPASPAALARVQLLEQELDRASVTETPEIEHLRECVQELPRVMKELLTLRYKDEMPVEQIAVHLVRTHAAVWQMLFRLRQQLKQGVEARLAKARP